MKPGLSLKEECEARMRRSEHTREGSRKRHLRSRRHSSSSSSTGNSSRNRRRHRSESRSSSRSTQSSRSRKRSKHSSSRKYRARSRSGSDRSVERVDQYGRRVNLMNVTNSKDPKMIASRVFIGSLPLKGEIKREDVEDRFGRHGTILGLTLLQGYGFIQYDTEESAVKAVEMEKDAYLNGFVLDVKLVSESKRKEDGGHYRERSERSERHSSLDAEHKRLPRHDGYGDGYGRGLPPPPPIDPYRRGPPPPPHPPPHMDPYIRRPPPHMDPYYRGPVPPFHRNPFPGDPYMRGPPPPHMDPFLRGPMPLPADPYRRHPYPEPYPPHYPRDPYGPPLPIPPPVTSVDCEVIVLDERQRPYADGIKKRLMSAGIVTEMNVLPPGVEILSALEEATRRRLLFAIIINDQNEIHKSITVNILHGLTQEHRNMPMEDAITLVTRSYDKYMIEKHEKIAKELVTPSSSGAAKKPDFLRPNANTLYLLNLLADNRFLTVEELDTVLDYLHLRRERLAKSQGREGGSGSIESNTPPPSMRARQPEEVQSVAKQPDLQSILGMLQSEKAASIDAAVKAQQQQQSYSSASLSSSSGFNTSINFSNPSVQQALDNLMSSGPNLLKSITEATKSGSSALVSYDDDDDLVDRYDSRTGTYGSSSQQQYREGGGGGGAYRS